MHAGLIFRFYLTQSRQTRCRTTFWYIVHSTVSGNEPEPCQCQQKAAVTVAHKRSGQQYHKVVLLQYYNVDVHSACKKLEVLPLPLPKLRDRPSPRSQERRRSVPASVWNSPSFPCLVRRGGLGRSRRPQITNHPGPRSGEATRAAITAHLWPRASGKQARVLWARGGCGCAGGSASCPDSDLVLEDCGKVRRA